MAQPVLFQLYQAGPDINNHLYFLRSILDNPCLASSVREVDLEDRIENLNAKERAYMYDRIANHLGFDTNSFPLASQGEEIRENSLPGDSIPTLIILLTPLLPNLRYLSIITDYEDHGTEPLVLLRRAGVLKPFESVTYLGLHYDIPWGFTMGLDRTILSLTPNLKTLELFQCCDVGLFDVANRQEEAAALQSEALPQQLHLPLGIRELNLSACRLERRPLANMLICCPPLERFSYSSSDRYFSININEVSNHEILEVLAASTRGTLEWMDLEFLNSNRVEYDDDKLTHESFTEFPALEEVMYNARVIFCREGDVEEIDESDEEE